MKNYRAQVAALWVPPAAGSVPVAPAVGSVPAASTTGTLVPLKHYALYKRLMAHPDPHPLAFKVLTGQLRASSDTAKVEKMQKLYDMTVRIDDKVTKDTVLRLGSFETDLHSLGYMEDDEMTEPNQDYEYDDEDDEYYEAQQLESGRHHQSEALAPSLEHGRHHRDEDDEGEFREAAPRLEHGKHHRRGDDDDYDVPAPSLQPGGPPWNDEDYDAASLNRGRSRNRDDDDDYYSSAIALEHGRHHHGDDEDEEEYRAANTIVENALRERRDATGGEPSGGAMPLYVRGAETAEQIKTIDSQTQVSDVARLTQLLATRFEASSSTSLEECGCRECDEEELASEDRAIAEEFLKIAPHGAEKVLVQTKPARRYRSRDGKAMVREYKVETAPEAGLASVPLTLRHGADAAELHVHPPVRDTTGPLYSAQGNDSDRPNVVFRYGPDGKELTHIYIVTKYGDNWFTRTWRGITGTKKAPEAMYVYPNREEDVDVKRQLLETLARDPYGRAIDTNAFDRRFRRSETYSVKLIEQEGKFPHTLFSSETQVVIRQPVPGGSLGQLDAYIIEEIDLDFARADNVTKSQILSWNQHADKGEKYLGRRLELEVGEENIFLRPNISAKSIMEEQLRANVWYSHSPRDRKQPAVVFHFESSPDGDPANDRLARIYLVRRNPSVSDAYGGAALPLRVNASVNAAVGRLAKWVETALADPKIMAKLNDALVTLAQDTTLSPDAIKKRVHCGHVLAGFLASPATLAKSSGSWLDLARSGTLKQPVVAGNRITGPHSLASKTEIQQIAQCVDKLGECMIGLKFDVSNNALQAKLGPLLKTDPTRAIALISSFAHVCTAAAGGHRVGSDRVLQLWDARTRLETTAALDLFSHE